MRHILSVGLLLLFTLPTYASTIKHGVADVKRVIDGDTIEVSASKGLSYFPFKVRLKGIEAFEYSRGKIQPLGKEGKELLEAVLPVGSQVDLTCYNTTYDRLACTVYIGDKDAAERLVSSGLALAVDQEYEGLEFIAQLNRVGCWGLPSFEHPKAYRDRLKMERKAK